MDAADGDIPKSDDASSLTVKAKEILVGALLASLVAATGHDRERVAPRPGGLRLPCARARSMGRAERLPLHLFVYAVALAAAARGVGRAVARHRATVRALTLAMVAVCVPLALNALVVGRTRTPVSAPSLRIALERVLANQHARFRRLGALTLGLAFAVVLVADRALREGTASVAERFAAVALAGALAGLGDLLRPRERKLRSRDLLLASAA